MKKLSLFLSLIFCLSCVTMAADLVAAAGSAFINSAGDKTEAELSGKIVGFYFSSSRQPDFAAPLAGFYSGLKQAGKDFEIIFVSYDKDAAEMMQFMQKSKMPWLAVPIGSTEYRTLRQIKKNDLKISGPPGSLVIVKDGNVLTETGKQDVETSGAGAYEKWLAMAPATAGEPAANKKARSGKKGKGGDEPQAVAASKLPPPEKDTCRAIEMDDKQSALAGKIVKIKFNRITALQKTPKGQLYVGNLGSSEKSDGEIYYDHPGIDVILPQEGLGCLSKFITKFGSALDDVSWLIKPDMGDVYVKVGRNAKEPSIVVGDRYEQDGDEGKYKWSTDTEIPDLTAKDKVTTDDVLLYPDQLNGKTIVMEFYVVGKVPKKSVEESPAYVSCGRGHAYVQIAFPPEGKEFFKTIADQENFPKANTVYAVVTVSRAGVVTLEAKGRRASGSGDDVTYKW